MFTRTALSDAVATALDPDVSVATIEPIAAGNNRSYRVTCRDGDALFLKVGTRFPDRFPTEPRTMEVVRSETAIPVPEVHGTGIEPLGYPFGVYEFVPDADYDWIGELPPPTAEQLCREAGRHLDDLHDLALPASGHVGVDGEDPAADGAALVVDETVPFHEMLERTVERRVDQLGNTTFADWGDPIRNRATDLIDRIDFDGIEQALVHGDYRLDNLCLTPEKNSVTAAVLDWELPTAADPLWDAVMAQMLLAEGHRTDSNRRDSLRTAFWEGYGGRPPATARRECYELLGRVRLAVHLDAELADGSHEARASRVHEHETALEALLRRGSDG